jgi:ribosomal protein S18 acetylase RimI-like enzyme
MTEATYDLYWIAVDPKFQGRGIGSRLVDFLEETLKAMGARMILIETSSIPSYDKTQRFYLYKGFQEVARVPNYYHAGNDRVTYCKRID